MSGGWHSFSSLPPPDQTKVRGAVRTQTTWTMREVNALRHMRSSGCSNTEVAEALGRTRASVNSQSKRIELTPLKPSWPRWTKEQVTELQQLRGLLIAEISQRTGRTEDAVRCKLKRMGISRTLTK